GVRLLSLLLDDDYNRLPEERRVSAQLSDERVLCIEASSNGSSLLVRVTYFDPVIDDVLADEFESSLVVSDVQEVLELSPSPRNIIFRIQRRLKQIAVQLYWPPLVAGATALLLFLLTVTPSLYQNFERKRVLAVLEQTHRAELALVAVHDVHRVG